MLLSQLTEQQIRERIETLTKALAPPPPGVQPIAEEITRANRELIARLEIELFSRKNPKELSIPEMERQISILQNENSFDCSELIATIKAEINARKSAPVTPAPAPPPAEQIKHTAQPPPPAKPQLSERFKLSESSPQPPITSQPITIRTPGAQKTSKPIPATIQADHETNPFDPILTIVWQDGYQFFGTESIIKSQFLSRMRNLSEMKDAKDPRRRQNQLWAWDTPWRCLGLFQALVYFYGGQAPTLQQLGVDMRRVSNLFIELFQFITQKALQPQP